VTQAHVQQSYAEQIMGRTLKRIKLIGQGEDIWDFHATIKSLSESTSREYAGRAVVELVQNGHDVLTAERPGRVHVLLDCNPNSPTLYVANEGDPFVQNNFRGIVDFGLSSKVAGQGIGNKGLGFRSVLQLTDHPEVYSRDPSNPTDDRFTGYSFRYPRHDELATLASQAGVPEHLMAAASPLDLPVPAGIGDNPELRRFAAQGFATVVKLPLRDEAAITAALEQIAAVESAQAPTLLFLDRLTELRLEVRDPNGAIVQTTQLSRTETHTTVIPDQTEVRSVDLGDQGNYLLLRGAVNLDEMKAAISQSVTVQLIDPKWLDWDSTEEVWVGVALRIDEALDAGTVYTFLPTEQSAPLCAHIQAPFFANLARRQVEFSVPLNTFLINRVAATCIDFMRILRDNAPQEKAAVLTVDLIAWEPEWSGHLLEACSEFTAEKCLAVADGRSWSCLDEAYTWPTDDTDSAQSVITPAAVARLGYSVVQPEIGRTRTARLGALHAKLRGTGMHPDNATVAEFVEQVAAALHKKKSPTPRWTDFYTDLLSLFDADSATELKGRRIILDNKGRLQRTMSDDDATTTAPVIFLPEDPSSRGGNPAHSTRVPSALARRIVYAHSDIEWTKATDNWQSADDLLVDAGLVHRYGTDELLEIIGGLLESRPTQAVQSAALEYCFALYPQLEPHQRSGLGEIPFTIPARDGKWRPARTAAFSAAWNTPGGTLLEKLVRAANSETPQLLALRDQLIADPDTWPLQIDELTEWKKFLEGIGVTDGLPLIHVKAEPRIGFLLQPALLSDQLGFNPATKRAWGAEVHWNAGRNGSSTYAFATELSVLPGAGEIKQLDQDARTTYAELIALGLNTWQDHDLKVKVHRPDRSRDERNTDYWYTPAAAYLRQAEWVPLARQDDSDEERDFVRCAAVWLPDDVPQLPDFVPHMASRLRGQLMKTARSRERTEELGVRIFGSANFCADMLREFPTYFDEGRVTSHRVNQFKRQYRQAWDNLLRGDRAWPWPDEDNPVVVTTAGARLESVELEEDTEILVQDEADPTKQSLITLTGQHVLLADPAKGKQIASLLQQHHDGVKLTSELSVDVYGDEQLILPSDEYLFLISDATPWVTTIIALVAEFKSGSFVRTTEQSINTLIQRLRKIRVIRVASARFIVAGSEILPPEHTKCLPLEDESNPTIVIWSGSSNAYGELEQCAPAIASLVHNPELTDHLALVFTRLSQAESLAPGSEPTDSELAKALQISVEQVVEARAGLRGSTADLLARLRIVVSYFASDAEQVEFDDRVRNLTDTSGLKAALDPIADLLPASAKELIELCGKNTSLTELREHLKLDFQRFNAAIVHADRTQPPLTYPDKHNRAFSAYVAKHRTAILNSLREAYALDAQLGGDLSSYAAAKNFEDLSTDPGWLSIYETPPPELIAQHVAFWLGTHNARDDLAAVCELASIDELHQRNYGALEDLITEAEPRVRAWCRANKRTLPASWKAPLLGGRTALEVSQLADFYLLTPETLFAVVMDDLGWPDGMPPTLELSKLGLTEDDLLSTKDTEDGEKELLRHERTHITIDGREISANAHDLGEIAEAVARGITEETLSQSQRPTLKLIPTNDQRGGIAGQGRVAAAARRDLSDEQRTAIGLAGEIAAKLWLERRYPKVEWVSRYRNEIQGGSAGSDSYGYDFWVETQSGQKRYFEVKAFTADISDGAEFMLGETEVRAAQEHGTRYEMLLVSEARDSDRRRIITVPNPLSSAGRGRYSLLGKGLRYRCQFDYSR
jgi:hypothetical protein